MWDSAILDYAINQKPCNTFILNDLFSPLGYGIGLPLNSPYKDVISEEILKLRESGFLDKLKNEWFVHKGKYETFVEQAFTHEQAFTNPPIKLYDLKKIFQTWWFSAGSILQ